MAEPVPDILVELLALGELDDDEAAQVRAQLVAEDDPRLDAIAKSDAEILERYPVQVIAPRLQPAGPGSVVELSSARSRRTRWTRLIVGGLAAAAAVAIVWVLGEGQELSPSDRDGPDEVAVAGSGAPADLGGAKEPWQVRHKGIARLIVHKQGGKDPLRAGATVAAGELLQLSYATGPEGHGVIVSLDGSGIATQHWPSTVDGPTSLSPGLVQLDHAYELDDAPGFERFFFVTSNAAIDPGVVLQAARALGETAAPAESDLSLPEGMSQVSFMLRKAD